MKKKVTLLPFIVIPIIMPIYWLLDKLILVDVFGCGCVPSVQENMLGIPFNANDLRLTVFGILWIVVSVWSVVISRDFKNKFLRLLYCIGATGFNLALALWFVKTFMWL